MWPFCEAQDERLSFAPNLSQQTAEPTPAASFGHRCSRCRPEAVQPCKSLSAWLGLAWLGLAWLAKCRVDAAAAAAVGAGLRLYSPESAQLVQDVVQRLVRPKAGRTRQRCAAVVVRRHKLRTQIRCRHLSLCADRTVLSRWVLCCAALRCAALRIVAARSTGTPAQFRRGNAVERLSAQVGGSNCRALVTCWSALGSAADARVGDAVGESCTDAICESHQPSKSIESKRQISAKGPRGS